MVAKTVAKKGTSQSQKKELVIIVSVQLDGPSVVRGSNSNSSGVFH